MCMFCAAIPMSLTAGAALAGKQTKRRQQAEARGEVLLTKPLPVGKMTAVVTGGLLVCSAVYHLVIMPHTGAII